MEETNNQNSMPEENAPSSQMDNSSQNSGASHKPYNLTPNMEAALCYLLMPLTGIIVMFYEKENKFVKFHAAQSIVVGIFMLGLWIVASALTFAVIGALMMPFITLGGFVLWLILVWKAYNNEEWEVPYLGKFARDLAMKI